MTDIRTLLDQSIEDLLRAQSVNPSAGVYDLLESAIGDLMAVMKPTGTYSSHLAEAVLNMRVTMTASASKGKRPDDLPDVPALDLESVGRTHYTDPTGQLAVKSNAARTQHRDLLAAIDQEAAAASRCACDDPKHRDAKTAASKADYIRDIVTRWLPRPASAKERAETERANDPDAKGCTSCARTEVAKGVKRWEPIERSDLCGWCYRWKRNTGEAPPLDIVERHHQGQRIRLPA